MSSKIYTREFELWLVSPVKDARTLEGLTDINYANSVLIS